MEAVGAQELWFEIINRGLFDAKLAIEAASGVEGKLYSWPLPTKEEIANAASKKEE